MVLNVHRNHKEYYGREEGGKRVWRWGKRGIIYLSLKYFNICRDKHKRTYLSLHRHHQNDPCIKMGSDVSHFNVSLIVRAKVTRQCSQTATFEEKGERMDSNRGPSAYQPNALPLGQTGSLKRKKEKRHSLGSPLRRTLFKVHKVKFFSMHAF